MKQRLTQWALVTSALYLLALTSLLLLGCASLHTGPAKVTTDGMVKITKNKQQ
jgi:hypothetical protein